MSHAEQHATSRSQMFPRRVSRAIAISLDVVSLAIFLAAFAVTAWILIGACQAMSSITPTHGASGSQNLKVIGFITLSAIPLAAFKIYRAFSRRRAGNPWSTEKDILRKLILVFGLLFGVVLIPFLNVIIFMAFDRIHWLWLYGGIALSCLGFVVTFQQRRRGREAYGLKDSIASAARCSLILFGAFGILLMLSLFVIPGYQTSMLGRWIHAKVWLDADQVRQWAAQQRVMPDSGDTIPSSLWPSSLKRMSSGSSGSGRVRIGPENSVTLHWGGMFGHGGITITAPNASEGSGLKVEPGVWVWESAD